MGKSLIIRGADFRANAIEEGPLPTSLDITAYLPSLYPGHVCNVTVDGSITTRSGRTCLQTNFDISTYISAYGFDNIRVECLMAGVNAVPCVIGDISSAQTWDATSWPLGNHTQINVNMSTGSPSSTTPSDVIKVILYKA